mmetsp:Transcript_26966/g.104875  ORF Transcript_26966/g.104875 Transcript_26966/m.104875 type:complete len:150 (+) Transcript_26966:5717-6166(+)
MYRLTSHMAAGNGSFPFAGKMSMFSKSIKVRTRGSVYLRAVTFDTDSDLARNMGSGEPQSHFVQSRSDPDWFYETNFSRVSPPGGADLQVRLRTGGNTHLIINSRADRFRVPPFSSRKHFMFLLRRERNSTTTLQALIGTSSQLKTVTR